MAKAQKRSNREIKKPKVKKQPTAAAAPTLFTKGTLAPAANPVGKKRG